jgi:hypothetical protein
MISLDRFVTDFAKGIERADALRPRQGKYDEGLGPHTEPRFIALVMDQLVAAWPDRYGEHALEEPYPDGQGRCDICLPGGAPWAWAIEAKAVRALHNNGKPAPDIFKQLLSPYPEDRSAVTDAVKVLEFGAAQRHAILLWGFDYPDRPLAPLIEIYEHMLTSRVRVLERVQAPFSELVHPHHRQGLVLAWEVMGVSR